MEKFFPRANMKFIRAKYLQRTRSRKLIPAKSLVKPNSRKFIPEFVVKFLLQHTKLRNVATLADNSSCSHLKPNAQPRGLGSERYSLISGNINSLMHITDNDSSQMNINC